MLQLLLQHIPKQICLTNLYGKEDKECHIRPIVDHQKIITPLEEGSYDKPVSNILFFADAFVVKARLPESIKDNIGREEITFNGVIIYPEGDAYLYGENDCHEFGLAFPVTLFYSLLGSHNPTAPFGGLFFLHIDFTKRLHTITELL